MLGSALAKVQKVTIACCRLSKLQTRELFEILTGNNTLEYLDIGNNDISKVHSEVLSAVINSLGYANLTHAKLTKKQMKSVLRGSLLQTNLQHLNIRGNELDSLPSELHCRVAQRIKQFHYEQAQICAYLVAKVNALVILYFILY